MVDARALRAARSLLDDVDEGGDVVVGDPLPLEHALADEGAVHLGSPRPAGSRRLLRHDAQIRPGLDGEELDSRARARAWPRR